eukprot:jgi/Botrbrau1/958/Bobra.114_1s0003.2
MDLIAQYTDDSHSKEDSDASSMDMGPVRLPVISAAPQVDTTGLQLVDSRAVNTADTRHLPDATAREIYVNLPYEDISAPLLGPAHPHRKGGVAPGIRNHTSGHVEDHNMHAFHFDDQYQTFHSYGYAVAPGAQVHVGDISALERNQGATVLTGAAAKRRKTERRKDDQAGLDLTEGISGPWVLQDRQPWADKEVEPARPTAEQLEWLEQEGFIKEPEEGAEPGTQGSRKTRGEAARIPEKTRFHGKEEVDKATGRTWIDAPRDHKKENDTCFLPKKLVHTWSGHTKGVNAIRFFPGSGHLLLSAGLDGKIKIWDVFNDQKCMRTYMGFSKGVKDICFSNDGRKFLSTSYDKVIKIWDTETGQAIRSLGEGKMFFVAKFHPDEDKQNVVMAGCGDKKVYQFDSSTGDLIQTYDYHLAAVNTVTFVDEGRRFVTTSDDKTIRVWEYGIAVQIKYIADPTMHSIPAVSLHPSNQYFIGTSLDNQIVTYSTKDRFRQNRKKTFKVRHCGRVCVPAILLPRWAVCSVWRW